MSLFEKVSGDIAAAMKARDKVRLEALRNIKKCFIEAKAAPGANNTLDDSVALKILAKLAKQCRDTALIYREQNRPDLASEEEAQAAVAEEYLPRQLDEDEIAEEVRAAISETGATSIRDMGKVMSAAMKRLAGRAEGQKISQAVRKLLA